MFQKINRDISDLNFLGVGFFFFNQRKIFLHFKTKLKQSNLKRCIAATNVNLIIVIIKLD